MPCSTSPAWLTWKPGYRRHSKPVEQWVAESACFRERIPTQHTDTPGCVKPPTPPLLWCYPLHRLTLRLKPDQMHQLIPLLPNHRQIEKTPTSQQ